MQPRNIHAKAWLVFTAGVARMEKSWDKGHRTSGFSKEEGEN